MISLIPNSQSQIMIFLDQSEKTSLILVRFDFEGVKNRNSKVFLHHQNNFLPTVGKELWKLDTYIQWVKGFLSMASC